jgi:hypothetical protein
MGCRSFCPAVFLMVPIAPAVDSSGDFKTRLSVAARVFTSMRGYAAGPADKTARSCLTSVLSEHVAAFSGSRFCDREVAVAFGGIEP